MNNLDVDFLGQVFTPERIVKRMISLIENKGSILEPSCGNGAFFNLLEGAIGIEKDSSVIPVGALNLDFFDYDVKNSFDTIIGNPPYVKYKNIGADTLAKINSSLFDKRTNLYLFFMEKCIHHLKPNGELIFIVPRDFIKATSAIKFNKWLYEMGTITDWFELGDKIIFSGFSPNCVIFRFEKGNFSRKTKTNAGVFDFVESAGQLLFIPKGDFTRFSDLFFVKVGAVSGADQFFVNESGNMDFVFSETVKTGKTRRAFYNVESDCLLPFKEELKSRKIKKFDDSNWFMWGRAYFVSDLPRIYVNSKTRNKKPFFIHDCKNYDGSVLAVFPRFVCDEKKLEEICFQLNEQDWEALGFVCDGRFIFSQKSLENTLLTGSF